MKYNEFILYVIEHFKDNLDASFDCSIKLEKVARNNGRLLDVLSVTSPKQGAYPMIYVKEYYEMLCEGVSIDKIMNMINQSFKKNHNKIPQTGYVMGELEDIKHKIYYRVINYKMNQTLLQDSPYTKILDLAFTYRIVMYTGGIGIASYAIKNEDLSRWNISLEELHEIALQNTSKLFPVEISAIEACMGLDEKHFHAGLYVMSNEDHINGATCGFYEGELQKFADKLESDLYMIPSSIHEWLLLATTTSITTSHMYEMVREGNSTVTNEGDILSYSVYHYSRETREITIVPN